MGFKHFRPLVPAFGFSCDELAKLGVSCDDMLERHPDGLEETVRYLHQRYGLPIYLTEHGSASADEEFRERDRKENLTALHRAYQQRGRRARILLLVTAGQF